MTSADASAIRLHFGFTQGQMAALLGIDRSRVTRIESGRHRLSGETVARYTRFCELMAEAAELSPR